MAPSYHDRLWHARGQRGDRRLDELVVHVLHIDDGKVAEFWACPHNGAAFTAFFS